MNKSDAIASIERYIDLTQNFGYPNEQSLREVKQIIFRLRGGPLNDSYFFEKIHLMEEWATIGFSTRKFARYAGGASQVRVFALGAASTAKDLVIEHWER